jgi:hypothetical protein
MQINNESDMALTWWCYNSNDGIREFTLIGGKGDIAPGGKASFNPPSNQTGYYYVQFTLKDGHLPSFWWKAANQWTYARCPAVRGDETLIYRGKTSFEAVVT